MFLKSNATKESLDIFVRSVIISAFKKIGREKKEEGGGGKLLADILFSISIKCCRFSGEQHFFFFLH
jgi:hypothetical protein